MERLFQVKKNLLLYFRRHLSIIKVIFRTRVFATRIIYGKRHFGLDCTLLITLGLLNDIILHTNTPFNSYYASSAPMTSKKRVKKAIEIGSNKSALKSRYE